MSSETISKHEYDDFDSDEPFTMKPVFRIFSRSVEPSGWTNFFIIKPDIAYPKSSVIISQGEENPNVFYIVHGLIEYTHTEIDGSEKILEILGPGNMLNLQPIFGHNPSIATFAALSDCVLKAVDKNEILSMIATDSNLALEMLEEMAFVIGGLNRWHSMGAEQSSIRTIRVIYMIAMIHKHVYKEEDPIYIRLSQSDLARIVQTTRVTISKILANLKHSKIIATDYGGISITNMEELSQLVKE